MAAWAAKVRAALSGLLVVAVGVLLALAGEAAWAERADRQREQEVLADLADEFRENEARLRSDIETNRRARSAATEWAEAMLGNRPTPADSLPVLLSALLSDARFDPVSGALRSLVDSGELQVIRSDDLRRALSGWTDRVAEARLTQQAGDLLRASVLPLVLSVKPGTARTAGQRSALQVMVENSGMNGQLEPLLERVREIAGLIELQMDP